MRKLGARDGRTHFRSCRTHGGFHHGIMIVRHPQLSRLGRPLRCCRLCFGYSVYLDGGADFRMIERKPSSSEGGHIARGSALSSATSARGKSIRQRPEQGRAGGLSRAYPTSIFQIRPPPVYCTPQKSAGLSQVDLRPARPTPPYCLLGDGDKRRR